jgi:putative endonuclease
MDKFFVYIIYSADKDKYYVGQTSNLEDRIKSHLSHISPYTSIANDWKLIYYEELSSRSEAIKRKNEIKRKKSRKYIEWLIKSKQGD